MRISPSLLLQSIAYRLAGAALGGLKSSTRRLLAKSRRRAHHAIADQGESETPRHRADPRVARGQPRVTVLENGVLFRGKRYRSLSEVARGDHRDALVGAAFLRAEGAGQETEHGAR